MLLIEVARDTHHNAEQVAHHSPDFAQVVADGDEVVTVVTVGEAGHLARVLVLQHHIVEELRLVQLDDVENLLCLLQLPPLFEVLEAIGVFKLAFDLGDVLFEDAHSLLPLTHGDQEEAVQSLTFSLDTKDELFHLLDQLLVGDLSRAPAMHAEVALGVEVAIGKETGLTPPGQSLSLLVVEQGHDTLLVVDVGFLANVGVLHFVNGLLEEFFVLSNEQFLYVLQSSLPLGD